MAVLAALVACVVLILVAAKTHGRQVRLEREVQGFTDVDFGGTNPPEVEAIWARDRKLFWPAFAVLAALGLAALVLAQGAALRLEMLVVLGAAFAGAFAVAGLASLARLHRAATARAVDGASVVWWSAEAAAWVALGVLAAWP